jgi:alpha-1,2-mannosyltransferase
MRRLMHTGLVRRTISWPWQRWFAAGLVVLALGLSIQYCVKAGSSKSNRSAILRWRDQLHHLSDEDIYQRYAYPNPPIMALILKPIAQLPPLLGSLTWFYLKLAMAVCAVYWVFRIVQGEGTPFPAWAKALTILFSLRPIMGDLSHGNVNLFILFLVVGSLYAFHRGRDLLAGSTLALAIACKVTPALFVPYFVWKRSWKALGGCLLGLLLFLFLVPGACLGGGRNLTLLDSWVNQMITPYVVSGTVTSEHSNQSLPGLVFRLATDNPSYVDEKGDPLRYDNFLSLSPRQAGWLIKAAMALFAGLIVWSCRTPITERSGWRLAAEFSLVVLGMLLFSERTWKHHCVTLVLPFAAIVYYLALPQCGPGMRRYLIACLAVALLFIGSTSTAGLVDALDEWAKRSQVYGAYMWANLVLVAALVAMLRWQDSPRSTLLPIRTDAELPSVETEARPSRKDLAAVAQV